MGRSLCARRAHHRLLVGQDDERTLYLTIPIYIHKANSAYDILVPMNLKVFDEFRKEDRNNLPIIDRNTHIAHPCFNRKWVHVIFVIGASSQISSAITRELTTEGGPGTGAYDQAELLSKDWDIVHISPTQVLKAEQVREGSKYADTITKFMAAGELVPLEVTVGLIQRNMQYHIGRGKFCFVIDGFPRRMDQAMAFENNVLPLFVVFSIETDGNRLLSRLLCWPLMRPGISFLNG